MKTMQIIN